MGYCDLYSQLVGTLKSTSSAIRGHHPFLTLCFLLGSEQAWRILDVLCPLWLFFWSTEWGFLTFCLAQLLPSILMAATVASA